MAMNLENINEDDDWNPDTNAKTIFDKVTVDMTDKVIKKNIEKDNIIDLQAMKLYKDVTVKEAMKQEKKRAGMEEEFESDEDVPFDIKEGVQNQNLFDENLYNPLQDDKYEMWVDKNLRIDKNSLIVLSCPGCFTQVSYDSQRHELYENQYRSLYVRNCVIDCTRSFEDPEKAKKLKPKTKHMLKVLEDIRKEGINVIEPPKEGNQHDDLDFVKDFEKIVPKDYEYFFPVLCKNCKADIGVYDVEEKIYHFFNTLPSLG